MQGSSRSNVALASNGSVASASSTTSPAEGLGNYEPSSAINGDRLAAGSGAGYSNNTFWRDGTADVYPDWLQVNFQGMRTIDEIDVYALQDNYTNPIEPTESMTFTQFGITNFEVQYWNGSAWMTLPGGGVTGNDKVWRRISFSPVSTDKIRVLVNNALFGRSRVVEVEAWGSAANNLAVGKVATQSSTAAGGLASRAVDGNRDGNYFNSSVTHTEWSANAWWQVDLARVQSIGEVKLWNRTDCCPERLSNFYVLVSDTPFTSIDLTATLNQAGVSNYYTPGGAGPTMTLNVRRTGRYVRVQLAGSDFLSLAEVEVNGAGSNVALASNGAVSSASSSHVSGNFPVAAVNNGDRTGNSWGTPSGGWNDNTQGDYSSDIVQVNFPAFGFLNEIDVFTLRYNFQDNQTPPTLTETFNTCDNSGYGITHFEVQYWTGSMWVTVPGGVIRDNNKVWRQLTFPEVWTSAVRVQVHGAVRFTTLPWNNSRIVEIEAYGRTAGLNLARNSNGSVAYASSQLNPNFPVAAINDGDRTGYNWGRGGYGSGWNDGTQDEFSVDWVRIDFAGNKVISEVDVYTLRDNFQSRTDDPTISETFSTANNTGNGITDYDVQYLAAEGWRLVPGGKVTNNDKVRRQFRFSPVTTSAVRVAVNRGVHFTTIANNWSRIVEIEAWENTAALNDFVWVGDSLPTGATPVGSWNWSCSNPLPLSGTLAHQSDVVAGPHQHYFHGATQTLTVNSGDTLIAYVYLDPANPPREVMLQWFDSTWDHRAYWGENLIAWGADGTSARRYMGPLPPTGQWVRLEVPASAVALEGSTVNGMAFTLFDGRATWDHGGRVSGSTPPPPPTVSVSDVSLTEGNSGVVNAIFNVTLSSASTQTVNVNYTTVNGTAVHMNDYMGKADSLTFQPGETSKTVSIAVFGDTDAESNETFFVILSNPVNATMADSQGNATIINDDTTPPPPTISVSDVSVTEGNSGIVNAVFNVTLSSSSTQTVSVNYTTVDGSARHMEDYMGRSDALTFQPGETSKTVSIAVFGDTDAESNETFFVILSNPVNATMADNQGNAEINNDDTAPPPPTISVSDELLIEGNSGHTSAVFSLTLSSPSVQTISVRYTTINGTAAHMSDYMGKGGTVTFEPGETSGTISVVVFGDTEVESDETFFFSLSNPSNATIADGQGVCSIINDDSPSPAISINDASVSEGNSGTVSVLFTVTLSNSSSQTVSISYTSSDGTATSPDDYTPVSGNLTFLAGQTTKTIAVPIIGDEESEDDESFVLDLSNPANATMADDQGIGMVTNDDSSPVPVPEPVNPPKPQNVALATNGATVQASSSRTGFPAANLIDGVYKQSKSSTNPDYWSDNTANAYANDWVQITFKQTYQLAVTRLYFLQNAVTPIEPTAGMLGDEAMREFKVFYKPTVSASTWTLIPGGHVLAETGKAGKVMVAVAFSELTEVAALRVEVKQGGKTGSAYSKIVEIQAWRTFIPHKDCELRPGDPNPCALLSDLDWAMKRYDDPPPHPQWEKKLDWTHNRWSTGSSQNWGPIAHAIALWRPVAGKDAIAWWNTFFDCQMGGFWKIPKRCTVDNDLKFLKGTELLSNNYDSSVTTAVAAVHYWATRITPNQALADAARDYLRASWAMYTLAAGKEWATQINYFYDASESEVVNVCHQSASGLYYSGPFIAAAGMRSTPGHLCQDGRGALLVHALQLSVISKREVAEQRVVLNHIELSWPPGNGRGENVYGLSLSDRTTLIGHKDNGSAATAATLKSMLGTARTSAVYHFLGWNDPTGGQVRATLMERNLNHQTVAIYGIKYTQNTHAVHVLFPWERAVWRNQVSKGKAELQPVGSSNPTTAWATNFNPADPNESDFDGQPLAPPKTPSPIHGVRSVSMPLPTSGKLFHVIMGPNGSAQ